MFRFQRPTLSGAHLLSISSTGLQPFSLHPESGGFRTLAGLLKMDLRELGVVAAELPQQVLWDQDDYSLDDFHLQLLQTGSRQRCGNSVYLLLRKLPGGGNAGPSGATPEAVLKLSSVYVPFEVSKWHTHGAAEHLKPVPTAVPGTPVDSAQTQTPSSGVE